MSKTKEQSRRKKSPFAGSAAIFSIALAALGEWRAGVPLNALVLPGHCRRLVNDLLYALFRHRASLDWMIDARLQTKKLKPQVRDLLRLGLSSCRFQDGLPEAVAVDSCVHVAKKLYGPRMGGLVNGVLRAALRHGPPAAVDDEVPEWVRLELGRELHAAWRLWMPGETLRRVAGCLQTPAPLVVRARPSCPATLPPSLAAALAPLSAPFWAPRERLWRCHDAARFFASELFAAGVFYIQDPSTLLAPSMLPVADGDLIGDLCAAPGGKTLLLAEKAAGRALIVAADKSPARLEKLRQNLAGGQSLPVLAGDALQAPFADSVFDGLLLDVPCSNTGVVRRRPDVRWRFSRQSLADRAALQRDILARLAPTVKPGGHLVYSTCSLEPCENASQVTAFLAGQPGWELVDERQLLPCDEHDGAYAASLFRRPTRAAP